MNIRLAGPLQSDSIVDGEGIRTVLWTQGCGHNCLGCHNLETHDFKGGYLESVDSIKEELNNLTEQDGITLSGGDPLYQVDACLEIVKHAKEIGLNVWCYTGFLFEDLIKNKKQEELLKYIDVLVDGKFSMNEFSLNLPFKGSRNQRIINVEKSLEAKEVILLEKYIEDKEVSKLYQKEEYLFI